MYEYQVSKGRSVESFNHDGVEVARRRNHRRQLPVRHLFLFVLAIFAFKIFLFLQLGAAGYGAKMTELSEGSSWERAAAKVMILDPVSQWVVDGIRHSVR